MTSDDAGMSDTPRTEAEKARYNEAHGMPSRACNCHHGSAQWCPVHTQADFAAATSSPAGNGEPDKRECPECGVWDRRRVSGHKRGCTVAWDFGDERPAIEGTRDAAPGLREALSRIAGWSAHYKSESRTQLRGTMQLIHDEAIRAHPDALAATPPSEAPSGLPMPSGYEERRDAAEPWPEHLIPSEAPSGGLDPERLARAIADAWCAQTPDTDPWMDDAHQPWPSAIATQVAAEYNRLSPTQGQGDGLHIDRLMLALHNAGTPVGSFDHPQWLRRHAERLAAEYAALATPAPDREP